MNAVRQVRVMHRCRRTVHAERYRGGAWQPRFAEYAGKCMPVNRWRRPPQPGRWRSMLHLFMCKPRARRRAAL